MSKIRKGDNIIVTAGKDKGKRGVVRSLIGAERLVVEGVNRVKKHVKPNPLKGVQGGLSEQEMPINISNVALLNPATQNADRVGFKHLADGRKVRVFKSSGEIVDV
ncbi:MAG: 50S ribosomal protein L24 [Rugosibacter sp.]|nr:50S ribosomal protein L24 [Rhodocyclales bacterium]MDO8347448.1 50S ribosomal protein L24 [Rugosibacter sp.]